MAIDSSGYITLIANATNAQAQAFILLENMTNELANTSSANAATVLIGGIQSLSSALGNYNQNIQNLVIGIEQAVTSLEVSVSQAASVNTAGL